MQLERLLGRLAILWANVLTGCVHASPPVPTSPEQLTVMVEPTTSTEACCGVVVAPTFVVTAAHCLREQSAHWVKLRDSRAGIVEARLASIDTGTDLALLRTRRDFSNSAELRNGRLDPSEPLSSVHSTSNSEASDSGTGQQKLRRVPTRVVDPNWLNWMLIDLPLRQGSSGSGVWDNQGRLAGIVLRRRNSLVEVASTSQIETLVAVSGAAGARGPGVVDDPSPVDSSMFPLTPYDVAAQILLH